MHHHKVTPVLWIGLELEPSTGSEYIDTKVELTRDFAQTLAKSIELLVPSFKVTGSDYAAPDPDVVRVVGEGIPGIAPSCFRYMRIAGEFDGEIPAAYFNLQGELPEWYWKVALSDYLGDAADIALQLSDLSHPGGVQCAGGAVALPSGVHSAIEPPRESRRLQLKRMEP